LIHLRPRRRVPGLTITKYKAYAEQTADIAIRLMRGGELSSRGAGGRAARPRLRAGLRRDRRHGRRLDPQQHACRRLPRQQFELLNPEARPMKKLALDFALALAVVGGTVAVSIPERSAVDVLPSKPQNMP
jgi:hypothetical protein